jgi:hypothetical protein
MEQIRRAMRIDLPLNSPNSPWLTILFLAPPTSVPKLKTERILLCFEDISASCASNATLLDSFDIEQKITARGTLDKLSFIIFGLASCLRFRSRRRFRSRFWLRPGFWFSSGFWFGPRQRFRSSFGFPFACSKLSCQLTHPASQFR